MRKQKVKNVKAKVEETVNPETLIRLRQEKKEANKTQAERKAWGVTCGKVWVENHATFDQLKMVPQTSYETLTIFTGVKAWVKRYGTKTPCFSFWVGFHEGAVAKAKAVLKRLNRENRKLGLDEDESIADEAASDFRKFVKRHSL